MGRPSSVFNTREIATGFWLLVILACSLASRPVRDSLGGVVSALCSRKLLTPAVLLGACTAGIVWVLYVMGVWTQALLKDTILWYLLTGPALAFSVAIKSAKEGIARVVLRRSVKAVLILQFLVTTHTFSMPVEFVLTPVLAVLAVLDAFADTDPRYAQVKKLTSALMALSGLAILASAIGKAVASYASLDLDALRRILLGPALSIASIPFIQLLAVYVGYEELFTILKANRQVDRRVRRHAKWRLMRLLGMRPVCRPG